VSAEVRELRGAAAEDVRALRNEANEIGMLNDKTLEWAAGQVTEVEEREQTLAKVIEGLQAAIERRDQNNQYMACIESARDAERTFDYDAAIGLYEEALEIQPGEHPEIQQYVDQLKVDWRIKGGDHQAARDFVYKQWGQADLTQIRALLPQAVQALITLKSHDDHLTARKLSKATLDHLVDVSGLVESLRDSATSDADRAELQQYADFAGKLQELIEDIADYLQTRSGAEPVAEPSGDTGAPQQPADTEPPRTEPPNSNPPGLPPAVNGGGLGDEEEEPPLTPP
jgi:hypothetical protein